VKEINKIQIYRKKLCFPPDGCTDRQTWCSLLCGYNISEEHNVSIYCEDGSRISVRNHGRYRRVASCRNTGYPPAKSHSKPAFGSLIRLKKIENFQMATNLMLIHVPRHTSFYEIHVNNFQTISSYLAESTMHLRYKMFNSVEGGKMPVFCRGLRSRQYIAWHCAATPFTLCSYLLLLSSAPIRNEKTTRVLK
jgi:hypothetical protein